MRSCRQAAGCSCDGSTARLDGTGRRRRALDISGHGRAGDSAIYRAPRAGQAALAARLGRLRRRAVVLGFSTIFSQLGVGPAIVQRPTLEDRHIRTGFTLSVLFSLTLLGLIWAGSAGMARFFAIPESVHVLQAASIVLVFQGLSAVAENLALRQLRFRWLAGVDAIAFATGFIGAAPILAWYGFRVWALVGAYLVQHAVRMVLLVAGQRHEKRPQLEGRAIGELLYFGGGFTLGRVGNYLAGQGDNFVVGGALGRNRSAFTPMLTSSTTSPQSSSDRSSIVYCFRPWRWCSASRPAWPARFAAARPFARC